MDLKMLLKNSGIGTFDEASNSLSHIAFIFSFLQMMKIGGVLMDFVQTTDVNMIFYHRSRRGAAAL